MSEALDGLLYARVPMSAAQAQSPLRVERRLRERQLLGLHDESLYANAASLANPLSCNRMNCIGT